MHMRKILALLTVLMLGVFAANAQTTRTINGRVTDSVGAPVVGASIAIRGTKAGAISGTEGQFSLSVKNGDVLSVTALNYAPAEVTITDQTTDLSITLTATAN